VRRALLGKVGHAAGELPRCEWFCFCAWPSEVVVIQGRRPRLQLESCVGVGNKLLAAVPTVGEFHPMSWLASPPLPSDVRYLLPNHLVVNFVLCTKLTVSSSRDGRIRVAGEELRSAVASLRGSEGRLGMNDIQ
jgi:hypothetical protein